MTVKLLDKETKALVDFEPNAVNAAVESGKFLFPKNRGVPVRADGQLKYISATDAAKYRDRLLFVNEEDVERGQAEERFGGLGGAAQALAYGGVKGLTLGTVPALASALSPEFAEYSRQIELGRPGLIGAAELASLAVDPFAVAGKALKLGAKGAQEAGAAAKAIDAAAQRAAVAPELALGEAAVRAPAQTPAGVVAQVAGEAAQTGRGVIPAEVSPLALGRQAISTPEEAARLTFRDRSRQSLLLREPPAAEFPVATGAVSTAEPGLRLGADIYQTPELAMRARQAEELTSRAQAARSLEARAAEEAAGMEQGLAPGQFGPVEDFTRPPSEFLQAGDVRNQMANIEESLQANAAATRRARSEASRERLAAERDRLLAQRDELEYSLFGAETRAEEAMAGQAERALEAAQVQAGAPTRRAVSEQMGSLAGEIEAANVIPPTLRTAETRVVSGNVSPRLGAAQTAKAAGQQWKSKGTALGNYLKEWYYKNRTASDDRLFFEAFQPEVVRGFDDALAAGAGGLESHGMAKASPSKAAEDLVNMIRSGLDPNRNGGQLYTAPLAVSKESKAMAGAGFGTAGGTSYRDGPFILVAKPGQTLEGDLQGLGAVLVNPALERISMSQPRTRALVDALREELHATRPDLIVDTYDNAGRVGRRLLGTEVQAGSRAGRSVSEEVGRVAGAAEAAGVSPLGLGMAEAGVVAPSGRLALGGTIPAREAVAATEMARGGATAIPPGLASMSAQGGVYGASEEARRQATGESQGGVGAILGAGALGAAIPAGLMLGGKVAAKGAQALATGAREAGILERIAAGASTVEKQHIARSFDLSRDQVTRLNNKFAIPEIEQQGTDAFVKFIKGELDDVSKLKAAFPDDAFLQSIPENTSLKFGQLTPDRKKAFADAVERFYGKEYDNIFTDAVRATPVDRSIIDRIIADTEAKAVAGAPQRGLESVAPELAAMRDYQGQHSVGTLRELQSRIGEIFRGRQGEGGKFTEAQAAMYGGLKRALADAVEAAEPGAAARLAENDVRYEMSKIMAEGANKVLSKSTTTSPIGRDQLSQLALGLAAIGSPVAAAKFFVTTVGLRHLYNTRGEGIIADMAGKLSTSLRKNPTVAATEAADIIVNARRPMLLGMSAMKLTDAKPEDYTSMSRAVRELEATRDKAKRQLADAISGLTPDEQQKSVEFFDNQLNALASALPKGIPTGKALNEQEKNYTIFARAILDPQVYGVQAILNGGPGASVAADAINSLGPQGQEFLQKLGDNLQARISESEQLRGREDMLQALRNVKSSTRKSVGGGARLRALNPSLDVKNIAKGAPSAFQNASKAFSGNAKTTI